ncbi:MAG: hypothetical protein JO040_15090, partial [Gemmatimonadetes bacterium]|nr:hypothetical protein [Gemmatimonadota bacterium]
MKESRRSIPRRRALAAPLPLLAVGALLAGCSDGRLPDSPPLVPAAHPAASAAPATPTLREGTYWRRPDSLWVFDKTPEVGITVGRLGDPASYTHAQTLGMRLMRVTLYWDAYASGAQKAEWDRLVANKPAGVELVAVVHQPPAALNNYTNEGRNSYAEFATFMNGVVRAYPQVKFWELFNEEDVGFYHSPDPNRKLEIFGYSSGLTARQQGARYAEMLRQVYPVVKRANPDAWVLVGGLAGRWDFIRGIYDGGGRDFFDFMAIHTYGVEATPAMSLKGRDVAALMAEAGVCGPGCTDAGRPLWSTEWGMEPGALYGAWGGKVPHEYDGQPDGPSYDDHHNSWWREALDVDAREPIYHKIIGHGLDAASDSYLQEIDARAIWPDGKTVAQGSAFNVYDFGFGLLRNHLLESGVTDPARLKRPAYDNLVAWDFNATVRGHPRRAVAVTVAGNGRWPLGYPFTRNADGTVTIQGVSVDNLVPTAVPMTDLSPVTGSTLDGDPVISFTLRNSGAIDPGTFQLTVDGADWRANAAPPTLTDGGKTLSFWSNVVNLPRGRSFTLRARVCGAGGCSETWGTY